MQVSVVNQQYTYMKQQIDHKHSVLQGKMAYGLFKNIRTKLMKTIRTWSKKPGCFNLLKWLFSQMIINFLVS